MERLVNNTMFLAGCDNAFRGHDEKQSSDNRGGFKELIRLELKTVLFKLSLIIMYSETNLFTSIRHLFLLFPRYRARIISWRFFWLNFSPKCVRTSRYSYDIGFMFKR